MTKSPSPCPHQEPYAAAPATAAARLRWFERTQTRPSSYKRTAAESRLGQSQGSMMQVWLEQEREGALNLTG